MRLHLFVNTRGVDIKNNAIVTVIIVVVIATIAEITNIDIVAVVAAELTQKVITTPSAVTSNATRTARNIEVRVSFFVVPVAEAPEPRY
jgi:hypothetical protein